MTQIIKKDVFAGIYAPCCMDGACLALTFAVALTASGFAQSLKPVTMPKPPADTRKPLTVQPVNLGAVPKPVAAPKPQPVTLRHAVLSVTVK